MTLASERDDDRREDDGRDRLVVHRLGVIGGVAGFDHQGLEDVGPDDGHADRQDRDADGGRHERREGDPEGDPATHQAGPGAERPTPGRAVADATDGGDIARRLGVVAELVAQAADVDVDRAVEDLGLVLAVDGIEQLVARQDAPIGLEQGLEQPELDPGQLDGRRRRGGPRSDRGP